MQIKRFFATLVQKNVVPGSGELAERIIAIDNMTLGNPAVRNREVHLTAKFVAVTYSQEEVAAKDKDAKDPKKAGTPAKPSAATPAGAKARTEEAIDKGDATNRNAAGVDEAKTPAGDGSAKLKGGI